MKLLVSVALLFVTFSFLSGCATTDNNSNNHTPTLPEQKPSYTGSHDAALTAAKMF
jgi:hypothetical protein